MQKAVSFILSLFICSSLGAQQTIVSVDSTAARYPIPHAIYGQFAEHLGSCIYGGVWVGKDADIPNENGYRLDVLHALEALHIPVIRWPGGCFADNYHWRDGIGPQSQRPKMVNTNWGGTVEDNSFGTHEFLNLCERLGAEPYISANVGSGSVREVAEWVEYMTSNDDSPMANLRRQNGRDKAWKVYYLGIGNESWGCGGQMTPEYYSNIYRQYAEYAHSFSGNTLFKVASGASDYDYHWTKTLMEQVGQRMSALSLHYYFIDDWFNKGKATPFSDSAYYALLGKSLGIEPVIQQHLSIMNTYDPQKNIKLLVDEWGTWWDVEDGTNPGHLFQQQTMRDAIAAALTLNIFHRYTDRIAMSNIAQMVNVLQAMILTQGDKMVLTPSYYVYLLYRDHADALHLPLRLQTDTLYPAADKHASIPRVSATASTREDGGTITLTNTHLHQSSTVVLSADVIRKLSAKGHVVEAQILTTSNPTDANTFDHPDRIQLQPFTGYRMDKKQQMTIMLPPMSVVHLRYR